MVNPGIRTSKWLTVGLLPVWLIASPAPAAEIGFDAAVQQALQANPRAHESAAQTAAAEAGVQAARGTGLPRVSFQLNAARSNDPLKVFGFRLSQREATFRDFGLADYAGPGSLDSAPGDLNYPGYATNYDTALAVTMPLFAGGGDEARVRAARAQLEATRQQQAMTREQLIFDVLRTYQGVYAARDMARAAHQARLAAERFVNTAEKLQAQGVALKSDVLTARAHLAAARAEEQAARAGVADAEEAFRVTLGRNRDSDVLPAAPVALAVPEGTLADMEARALGANLNLQAMQSRVEASDAGVDAARAGNWPRVDLMVRRDWNAATPALDAGSNTLVASMTWDLFSSGAQQGSVHQAESRHRAASAALRGARDHVRLGVARGYRAMDTAESRVKAGEEAQNEAAEAARLVNLRYEQGIATLNDVLDAQARLDRARAQLVQARYDDLLARAALRLMLNDLDPAAVNAAPATNDNSGESP
ncbi:MAG: TolC family protein [Gammaproteobacteria bacterium]|jgi:outer membrane protein TolC